MESYGGQICVDEANGEIIDEGNSIESLGDIKVGSFDSYLEFWYDNCFR